jgi:hypothetical protein
MVIATIVVARYQEDLSWLNKIPSTCRALVFNKGAKISLEKHAEVVDLPNFGRESDTYLRYLLYHHLPGAQERVIFTQGDPFEHSPDFLSLLTHIGDWSPIQPLSWRYTERDNIPPISLLMTQPAEFIRNCRVRSESFSLHTWAPVSHIDKGAVGIGSAYRAEHGLLPGTNIGQHFLSLCMLEDLAAKASVSEIGSFSYAAIFSVMDEHINKFVRERCAPLSRMMELAGGSQINGYMFERMWLHLFGTPFSSIRWRLDTA